MFLMNSIDFMLMGVYIMSWLNSLTVLPLTKMMLLCALWIITLGLHYICQNVFRFKPSVIMFTGPQEVKARGEGGSSWFRGRHKAHRSKVMGPQHHFWAHSITFFLIFFFFSFFTDATFKILFLLLLVCQNVLVAFSLSASYRESCSL